MRGANPSVPVWLVVAMAVLLSLMTHRSVAAEFDSAAPSAAPVMGELRIEGEALERITLARMLGEGTLYDAQHPLVLERPGPSISVPAGKYCLRRIDLNGGYHSDPGPIVEGRNGRPVREAEWLVIIRPDQPCVVKIGVPLKPKVFAYRSGRCAVSLVSSARCGGPFVRSGQP